MKDIKAKILSNNKISHAYYKMVLDAPYISRMAKPGQFVQVKCGESMEPLLRRPFSIHRIKGHGAPLGVVRGKRGKAVEILYEVIGKGTEMLSHRKEGEFLNALGPLGNGFTLPRVRSTGRRAINNESRAIIIAGGIGAAPLVCLAEELTRKKIKTIVLIGAKTKDMILCEKDFKKVTAEVYISTDDGTYGSHGLVSNLFHKILKTTESRFETVVYVCGPRGMLKCIAGICHERNFECQVSMEESMACGIGVCLGCNVLTRSGNKLVCKDGPVFDANEIIWP